MKRHRKQWFIMYRSFQPSRKLRNRRAVAENGIKKEQSAQVTLGFSPGVWLVKLVRTKKTNPGLWDEQLRREREQRKHSTYWEITRKYLLVRRDDGEEPSIASQNMKVTGGPYGHTECADNRFGWKAWYWLCVGSFVCFNEMEMWCDHYTVDALP